METEPIMGAKFVHFLEVLLPLLYLVCLFLYGQFFFHGEPNRQRTCRTALLITIAVHAVTLVDALGRGWQCGTIQVDYQLPSKERLNAEFIGDDNAKHTPVMLHRAALGSLERFLGILIEHYAGALPAWLSPRQVVVVPVAPGFDEYVITSYSIHYTKLYESP